MVYIAHDHAENIIHIFFPGVKVMNKGHGKNHDAIICHYL